MRPFVTNIVKDRLPILIQFCARGRNIMSGGVAGSNIIPYRRIETIFDIPRPTHISSESKFLLTLVAVKTYAGTLAQDVSRIGFPR